MRISVNSIDALLPQTQCTKCGYKDCRDYAKAIFRGEKHNRCPPGGDEGIQSLSQHLNRPILPLDENCGQHKPKEVAIINEALCIGCEKCILVCPVDAIIGAKKRMHTILIDDCAGCDLCVEPCPMDCIQMIQLPQDQQPESATPAQAFAQKDHYRKMHQAKQHRLQTKQILAERQHQENITLAKQDMDKKAYIQKALVDFKKKKQKLSE